MASNNKQDEQNKFDSKAGTTARAIKTLMANIWTGRAMIKMVMKPQRKFD